MEAMREAAQHLVGDHDFRNLCKMDIKNGVTNFRRIIDRVVIRRLDDDEHGYGMCEITVVGTAFLWHQIRCIVAVLFMVGQGHEQASIVKDLLNIETNPRKPQYTMAADLPLTLFSCEYTGLEWQYDADTLQEVIVKLQTLWTESAIKSTLVKHLIDQISDNTVEHPRRQLDIVSGRPTKNHKRLLERNKCETLEDRVEQALKKNKLMHVPTQQ